MSWHTVSFLMSTLIALASFAFILLLLNAKRGVPVAPKDPKLTISGVKAFLTRRKNAQMLISIMLYAITQTGLLVWIVRYMTLQYHAEALGSVALSLYWVFGTISRLFAPRLRMRPLFVYLMGLILACVTQTVGVLSGSAVVMCAMCGLNGLSPGIASR
jgi:hypothetical protein